MPGIVIQANFDLMQEVPLDSRLVATNSLDRDAIQYKYAGMKVYQKDINRTWTWNGTGWDAEGSGIYGGSGSLIGDTFINMGSVSTAPGSQSSYLVYRTDTTATTEAYIYNGFVRHSTTVPSSLGTEFIQQYKYFDGANLYNASHISYNPKLGGSDVIRGGLAFHTGNSNNVSERMRITGGGNVGIGTNDPKEFLQIGTTSSPQSAPLVVHNSGSAVIGHNWYFSSNQDQYFEINKPSTKIIQSNGSFIVQNRLSGQQPGDYSTTLFTIGTNGGRVGIRTTNPVAVLDVNGDINSSTSITGLNINGGTVSSSNRVRGKRFDFTNLANTSMTTGFSTPGPDDNFILTVRGTQSFRSNGNANFLFGDTYYYDTVSVGKNLDVVGYTDVSGNLTVKGTSSITNFEPSTQLVPTNVYRHTLSAEFTTPESLSSFTYSFKAYRIGALVNMDITVETTASISVGNEFWGIMFKFNNERFKPVGSSFGHGTGGKSYPDFDFYPLNFEAFQVDPTSGGAPSVTANEFYLRLRTTRISSTQGDGFRTGTIMPTGTKFRGTITYKAGNIASTSTVTPPIIISLPSPSTSES